MGYRLNEDSRNDGLCNRLKDRQQKYTNYLLKRKDTITNRQKKTLERRESMGSDSTNIRNRTELSKKSWNFVHYVRIELKHLQSVQTVLVNPVLAHHKFKHELFIDKTMKNIADQLTQNGQIDQKVKCKAADKRNSTSKADRRSKRAAKRSTLVFLGDFKLQSDSPMKGNPRSASGNFKLALKRRCDVILINECNTTKCCLSCNKKLERFCQCLCSGNKRKVRNWQATTE